MEEKIIKLYRVFAIYFDGKRKMLWQRKSREKAEELKKKVEEVLNEYKEIKKIEIEEIEMEEVDGDFFNKWCEERRKIKKSRCG